MKEENVRLKDQLRSLLLSQDDKSPDVTNTIIMDGLHGDGMDNISDLISCQAEINKLSTQLAKVTAQCQYWKEVANQNTVSHSNVIIVMTTNITTIIIGGSTNRCRVHYCPTRGNVSVVCCVIE